MSDRVDMVCALLSEATCSGSRGLRCFWTRGDRCLEVRSDCETPSSAKHPDRASRRGGRLASPMGAACGRCPGLEPAQVGEKMRCLSVSKRLPSLADCHAEALTRKDGEAASASRLPSTEGRSLQSSLESTSPLPKHSPFLDRRPAISRPRQFWNYHEMNPATATISSLDKALRPAVSSALSNHCRSAVLFVPLRR